MQSDGLTRYPPDREHAGEQYARAIAGAPDTLDSLEGRNVRWILFETLACSLVAHRRSSH